MFFPIFLKLLSCCSCSWLLLLLFTTEYKNTCSFSLFWYCWNYYLVALLLWFNFREFVAILHNTILWLQVNSRWYVVLLLDRFFILFYLGCLIIIFLVIIFNISVSLDYFEKSLPSFLLALFIDYLILINYIITSTHVELTVNNQIA